MPATDTITRRATAPVADRRNLLGLRATGHSVANALINPLSAASQSGSLPAAAVAAGGQLFADRIGFGPRAASTRR